MFASEMGMLFLPFICCIEFVAHVESRKKPGGRVWLNGAEALAVTLIYLGCRYSAIGQVDRGVARPAEGFWYNLLRVSYAHLETLKTILLHWKLTYFHTIQIAKPGESGAGIAALALHVALILAAFLLIRIFRTMSDTCSIQSSGIMIIPIDGLLENSFNAVLILSRRSLSSSSMLLYVSTPASRMRAV